ncbi:MAG: MFS transporter [Sedimentisphaerales bacterium]|nr:MFS transporter [Sedimentisphaerales bacterium]
MENMSMNVRIRLSVMMFLQYMMLPVWWLPLATYLEKVGLDEWKALIMSTMALGCLSSPLIGTFADRHFASQYVLAVLNLFSGVLLIIGAQLTSGLAVFIALLLAMLAYMPTWGLTSSISMAHSRAEEFPNIRVFGSIGWVAAGIFSIVALYILKIKIDGTKIVFYCGAAVSFIGAAFAFFLPHTPPPAKGTKASVVDVLGLRSFSLFKYPDFALYVVVSIMVTIAFSIYWSYFSLYLTDKGVELLTFTQNFGQAVEIVLMLVVPIAIAKIGLKWAMVVGLLAQLVRYGSLLLGEATGAEMALAYVAILVHGLIFGFFFVGGQIYVDRKAPKEMRAQAQGFMFLATFGVGLLIGNFLCDWLIKAYTVEDVRQWQPIWLWTTIASAIVVVLFAIAFHDRTQAVEKSDVTAAEEEEPAVI